MREILVDAPDTEGIVKQLQAELGGTVNERWGEHILTIDSDVAQGNIRFIPFEWGVNLLEYNITFFEEVALIMDTSKYNPIHFAYCLEGYYQHRFDADIDRKKLEQFQSVIITSTKGGHDYTYFPENEKLEINIIQIVRKLFLQKRLNKVSLLNQELYRVFVDTDHQKAFAFLGSYNLKLADKISALRNVKQKGMIRLLQIEGLVYQILSMHIQQHDREIKNKRVETSLLKRELRTIRKLAKDIIKNPSKEYTLEQLSFESGLTQAKLQEGFKLLYTKTVTEYIRHVRLEAARDLIVTTDMNISEVVYSIGFSSRSYFSKIFKNKYGISPRDFQKKQVKLLQETDAMEEQPTLLS